MAVRVKTSFPPLCPYAKMFCATRPTTSTQSIHLFSIHPSIHAYFPLPFAPNQMLRIILPNPLHTEIGPLPARPNKPHTHNHTLIMPNGQFWMGQSPGKKPRKASGGNSQSCRLFIPNSELELVYGGIRIGSDLWQIFVLSFIPFFQIKVESPQLYNTFRHLQYIYIFPSFPFFLYPPLFLITSFINHFYHLDSIIYFNPISLII
jgi:hypothetical protein